MTEAVVGEVICGAVVASCTCRRPAGHPADQHECACGGKWRSEDYEGGFRAIRWPGIFGAVFDRSEPAAEAEA